MKKLFTGKSLQFLNKSGSYGVKAATGSMNFKTADDLEMEADQDLSNFDGGGGGYIGLGDPFLNFSGNTGSFAEPISRGKLYTITLTNVNANARTAKLCPGLLYNAVGLITDGAFNDTTGAAGLSASGTPQAIVYFNAFINQYPTLVAGFKVSTNNILQFEQDIVIYKQSPFKTHASRIINVAAYASEANPNTTLISVQESFYMDNQTVVEYTVLGATSVSIGLFFGVSLNIAYALRSKTETAKANMSRAGVNPAVMSSYRGLGQ